MIKEVLEKDFNIFFQLMAEVECGDHFDFANQNHVSWLKRRIATRFYMGTRFFAHYLDDGTPVGFAAVLIDDGPEGIPCFGHKAEITDIAIFPSFRGNGYGAELLTHVEGFAKQNGVYCLCASTYAKGYKVIAFYGSRGFVPVATLPGVHGPNDEGMVFVRKVLN